MIGAFGWPYKKEISQGLAFGIFRWIAVWFLLYLAAGKGLPGLLACYLIIAINLGIEASYRSLRLLILTQSRKDWLDRLTNRFFYKLLYEQQHEKDSNFQDIDGLFREASKMAQADTIQFEDQPIKGWLFLSGILHFLGLFLRYLLYYGSAIILGSNA